MRMTLWHNPRCSKSRQTLALLRERGIEPEVIEYLKTPPDTQTLAEVLRKLGVGARDLMRRGEAVYRAADLDTVDDEARLIAAMAAEPILIERPILIAGDRAAIGRPPEAVLDIL